MRKDDILNLPEVKEFINFHSKEWDKYNERSHCYDVMGAPFYKKVIGEMFITAINSECKDIEYYTLSDYMEEDLMCYLDQNYPCMEHDYSDWLFVPIIEICLDVRKIYLKL